MHFPTFLVRLHHKLPLGAEKLSVVADVPASLMNSHPYSWLLACFSVYSAWTFYGLELARQRLLNKAKARSGIVWAMEGETALA